MQCNQACVDVAAAIVIAVNTGFDVIEIEGWRKIEATNFHLVTGRHTCHGLLPGSAAGHRARNLRAENKLTLIIEIELPIPQVTIDRNTLRIQPGTVQRGRVIAGFQKPALLLKFALSLVCPTATPITKPSVKR